MNYDRELMSHANQNSDGMTGLIGFVDLVRRLIDTHTYELQRGSQLSLQDTAYFLRDLDIAREVVHFEFGGNAKFPDFHLQTSQMDRYLTDATLQSWCLNRRYVYPDILRFPLIKGVHGVDPCEYLQGGQIKDAIARRKERAIGQISRICRNLGLSDQQKQEFAERTTAVYLEPNDRRAYRDLFDGSWEKADPEITALFPVHELKRRRGR